MRAMKLFSKFHPHLNYTLVRLAPTLVEEEFLNCYAALRGAEKSSARLPCSQIAPHQCDAHVFQVQQRGPAAFVGAQVIPRMSSSRSRAPVASGSTATSNLRTSASREEVERHMCV